MAIKIDVSFSNGRAIDKCGNIWMPTGSPTINNEKIKWNAESYKGIPGTNFHTDDPINFDIGTGNYTLEAWVYSLSNNQNAGIIQLSQYVGGLTTDQSRSICLCGRYNWFGNGYFEKDVDTGSWRHYAIVRHSCILYAFVDGKIIYKTANNLDLSNLKYAVIGNYYNNGYSWNGYIDSIRVANHATYIKEFTPKKFSDNKWLYIAEDRKVYNT